jgi:Do/DeqQ family serine protease
MRLTPALAVLIALAVATGAPAQESAVPRDRAEIALSFAPVVRRAAPAVVNVYARKVVRQANPFAGNPFFDQFMREFGGAPRQRLENSLGSGVIMRSDGIVVTNAHVIENAVEIRVALADRREFDAEIIFLDRPSDLAVLRLAGARDLPTLTARHEDDLEVGDLALAIGNPFGVGQTVTMGIVSGLARSGGRRGGGYFIQTDAAINPGNSGGALVDVDGRLIGVNTQILSRSGGSVGIGFAIPASLVETAVATALAGGRELARPWLGLVAQEVTADLSEALGLPRPAGVLIAELHPASPLRQAGLRPGDVITALDGQPVDTPAALEYRLTSMGVGGGVLVGFVRRGEPYEAEARLIALPNGARR